MTRINLGTLPLNGNQITQEGDLGGLYGGLTNEYWFDTSTNSDLSIEVATLTDYFYGSKGYFSLFRDSNFDGFIDFTDYDSSDYIHIFSSPDYGEDFGLDTVNYTNLAPGQYALEVFFLDSVYDGETFVYTLDLFAEPNFPPAINTKSEVYRFFNSSLGAHFYTADKNERDYIANNLNDYSYEGVSYATADHLTGNSSESVYRFFNSTTGVHLYTTNENERDSIIDNLSNFTYEGPKFYAYEQPIEGTTAVHRFYEPNIGVHFYTPNEAEKIFVEENLPNYTYEGIAYYAFDTNVL